MRGKCLNQVMLLAVILAAGMLLAAHAPLHDYDLIDAQNDDHGHQPVDHQHPVRALAIAVFSAVLIVVAVAAATAAKPVRIGTDRFQSGGPVRCDEDIGLHDVLSVYQI